MTKPFSLRKQLRPLFQNILGSAILSDEAIMGPVEAFLSEKVVKKEWYDPYPSPKVKPPVLPILATLKATVHDKAKQIAIDEALRENLAAREASAEEHAPALLQAEDVAQELTREDIDAVCHKVWPMSDSWRETIIQKEPLLSKENQIDAIKLLISLSVFVATRVDGRYLLGHRKQLFNEMFTLIRETVSARNFKIQDCKVYSLYNTLVERYKLTVNKERYRRRLSTLLETDLVWKQLEETLNSSEKTQYARQLMLRVCDYYSKRLHPIDLTSDGRAFRRNAIIAKIQKLMTEPRFSLEVGVDSVDLNELTKLNLPVNNGTRKRYTSCMLLSDETAPLFISTEWQTIVYSQLVGNLVHLQTAESLLFAISKQAGLPPENVVLSKQPHLHEALFRAIVAEVKGSLKTFKVRDGEAGVDLTETGRNKVLEAAAKRVWAPFLAKLTKSTQKTRKRHQSNGIFATRRLHELSETARADNDHMQALMPQPKPSSGIEILAPYKTKYGGDRSLFDAFRQEGMLPRYLRDSDIKTILFPFADGADSHWRGVFIQKPAVKGGKIIVNLFDSFGPRGAAAIRKEVEELLDFPWLPKSQLQINCVSLNHMTSRQHYGYACGQYVISFFHFICAKLVTKVETNTRAEFLKKFSAEENVSLGGYNADVIRTFMDIDTSLGASADNHYLRIVSAVRKYDALLAPKKPKVTSPSADVSPASPSGSDSDGIAPPLFDGDSDGDGQHDGSPTHDGAGKGTSPSVDEVRLTRQRKLADQIGVLATTFTSVNNTLRKKNFHKTNPESFRGILTDFSFNCQQAMAQVALESEPYCSELEARHAELVTLSSRIADGLSSLNTIEASDEDVLGGLQINPALISSGKTVATTLQMDDKQIIKAVEEEIKALNTKASSWWPLTYWGAADKAQNIRIALENAKDKPKSLRDVLADETSGLYTALNHKRLTSFSFWTNDSWVSDKSRSLLNVERQIKPLSI